MIVLLFLLLVQLKLASVNQLVRKLTSEVESDVSFLKCFLMTYQSFITPTRLLMTLLERFDVPPQLMEAAGKSIVLFSVFVFFACCQCGVTDRRAGALKVKSRVVNVIKVCCACEGVRTRAVGV